MFSTQFYPEAKGGLMDTACLLDVYLEIVRRYKDGKRLLLLNDGHQVGFLLFNMMLDDPILRK